MAPAGKTRQRTLWVLGEYRLFVSERFLLSIQPWSNFSMQRDDIEMMQNQVLEEKAVVQTCLCVRSMFVRWWGLPA